MRRLRPNSDGPEMFLPSALTKSVFWNHTASKATASASVTTATGNPRTRRAGSPTTTPITIATVAARSGAIGKGTPQLTVSGLRTKPAAPARVSCASDTCPA